MKYFIKSTLLFFLFTTIVYIILLYVSGEYLPQVFKTNLNYRVGSYGHTSSRISELKTTKDVDVLFLGSSHAYRGFDTRYFTKHGIKSFNLGSSAQTPIQTRLLLNRYLDRLNPRLVIYEVYPITFSLDGVESAVDIIANDRNDFHSLQMALNINHIKVYNTLLYGWMRELLNKNAGFVEAKRKDYDTYVPGGFVERDMGYFQHAQYPKTKWDLNASQFESFEKIVAMLKQRNIKLILVNAPIPPLIYNSYTNNHIFDSMISRYGEYHNFNETMTLDDSLYFYDSNHLNQRGVELFDTEILELIKKRSQN